MDISGIKYLGIDRILSRGTGETIAELNNALLVRDNVSGAYFLACEDEKTGITLLDRYIGSDCRLLMVSDYAIGQTAFARYGFSEKLECYQFAYHLIARRPLPQFTSLTVDRSELRSLRVNREGMNCLRMYLPYL